MKIKYFLSIILIAISLVSQSQIKFDSDHLNPHQVLLPYNRIIQSAGLQIYFGDRTLENHSLDAALSPDNKWLAVEERYSIVFINTADKTVRFVLDNNTYADLLGGMNTYSGITWHKGVKGLEVLWSAIGKDNRSYVVSASWDGAKAQFGRMIEYKAQPPSGLALPNEFLIKKEDSKEYLYVVLNGNNKVIKQDFVTGDTIWTADPGVAPYGITMASGKLYVTNWAGRNPEAAIRKLQEFHGVSQELIIKQQEEQQGKEVLV